MLLPSGITNSCPERASSTTKPPFLSACCLGVKYSTWICARGQSAVAASNAWRIGVRSEFLSRAREFDHEAALLVRLLLGREIFDVDLRPRPIRGRRLECLEHRRPI